VADRKLPDTADALVTAYAPDAPEVGQQSADAPDLLAGMRNGAWLDAQRFPPLAYAVPGIVPEGFTLQVGAPKIGKSWCVLGYALAVASGGHALGAIPVDKRPVLLLALEDGHRRMQERCRSLLAGDPIPAGLDYLTDLHPGTVVPTIAEWMGRHPDDAPLVILDTLGKVMPPSIAGESAYGRDYRIGSSLKRLCDERPGSSLLVNHHDRKAEAADFVDSVSGTHGLAGAADTVVILSRERHEQTGLVMVTGRDVPEGEYAVKLADTGAWTLDGATLADAAAVAAQRRATAGVGDRSAEILGLVGQHPEGVRSAQVEKEVGPDARRYLARLVDSGRLVRPRRGLYLLPTTPVPSVPTSQEQDDGMGQRDSRDTPLGEGTTHLRSVADQEDPTP